MHRFLVIEARRLLPLLFLLVLLVSLSIYDNFFREFPVVAPDKELKNTVAFVTADRGELSAPVSFEVIASMEAWARLQQENSALPDYPFNPVSYTHLQIIRQAVELGVQQIIPVVTERSIARFSESREAGRLQRWRNLVRAAAKQCRRAALPDLSSVHDFNRVLDLLSGRMTVVPWEGEKKFGLDRLLKQPLGEREAVFLFIGPEGGFSPQEIAALTAAGARTVHLGPRILRTETAAAVTIALIQAAWGDLGVSSG